VTWRARFGILRAACVAFPALATACISSGVPDPRAAVDAYARAAERGDADALYGMMTTTSRQSRSREQVRAVVTDERAELAEQARGIAGKDVRLEATARLRFADGEEAALDLHDGRYWITAAGALPGGARTPEEALDQLRRVLARRSYAGLLRLLSPATRAAVENDLRALVDGLGEPATLPVQVTGDAAVVSVPGGHRVKLRREGGVWRIDDFD
jgi:hypothetical protein